MKNKTRNSLLTIVLAIAMTVALMPAAALAGDGSVDVANYGEFAAAIGDPGVLTINVTSGFELVDDVTINQEVTITSARGETITTDVYSISIEGSEADVTISGDLTVTGMEPIQVTDGGRFTLESGTITATGANSAGVYVSGGTADISGGTITTTGAEGYGILAEESTVTISGGTITATGTNGDGVSADGGTVTISGGTIEVTGANGDGVYVDGGTAIISGGRIEATDDGVSVDGDSTVTISDDAEISGTYGVYVYWSKCTISGGRIDATDAGVSVGGFAEVTIGGDAEISGDMIGVYVDQSTITISVSASLTISGGVDNFAGKVFFTGLPTPVTMTAGETETVELTGVHADISFAIDVDDTDDELSASIDGSDKDRFNLAPPVTTPAGTYTLALTAIEPSRGGSTLTLTIPVTLSPTPVEDAAISPTTGSFDLYDPDDVTTTITWNDATEVSDITAGGTSIDAAGSYTVTAIDEDTATLTIKKEYLSTQSVGSFVLSIVFDEGDPATLTITITDSTPEPVEDAAINPTTGSFDLYDPDDVTATITWNDATEVSDITAGGTSIDAAGSYTVTALDEDTATLTIKKEYLSAQSVGSFVLSIVFDEGDPATLTITVTDSTPVTYTVTYDANGGTGTAPIESNKASGATFAAAANTFTAPSGKQFKHWNTAANGTGTTYLAGATVTMPASALTLYAIWEAVPSSDGDSGGSRSGSSSPPPSPPGNTDQQTAVIAPEAIAKETATISDGKTVETFTIQNTAASQIEQAKEEGKISVEFNIASSQTAVTDINVPSTVLESASGMDVSISTPNATLELPAALVAALAAAGQDLNLTVTRGGEIDDPEGGTVLGSTTEITTDIVGETKVTIPLEGITIPADPAERAVFLNSLAVFTYHSDGETELITGEIIYDAGGNPVGITFPVDKFSTFAVVKLSKRTVTLTIGSPAASLNGLVVALDAPAFIEPKSNRALVPLRFVGEALGAKVEWNPSARQMKIKDGDKEILLTLDSATALVNGQVVAIGCAPVSLPPGRIFVPLRFIGEALGAELAYDDAAQRITITREYGK